MKTILHSRAQPAACALAGAILAGMLLSGTGLQAGEPIQFTNGKLVPKAKPGNSLTRGIESGPNESPGADGLDFVVPMFGLPAFDSKEEKRRKEAQVERENWMILDQGEIQDQREDDERFGIRSDRIEKEKGAADYWFSPQSDNSGQGPGSGRGTSAGRSRLPGQSRPLPPGANQARNSAMVYNRDAAPSEAKASATVSSQPQGAHISSELNPRNLFGPERAGGSQPGDKSSLSFKDLFGGPVASDDDRGLRSPLKGLGGIESRSSAGLDSRLDVRPPAALPAFAPANSGMFDSPSRASANGAGFDPAASGGGYGSGGSFGAAAASDAFSSRGQAFGNNYSPSQPAANNRARTSREFFERPKMVGQ